MGILRSEAMKRGTLVLPIDRARFFIDLIGKNTKMQFEDMNARNMQRPYKKYIQRLDELERILRFLLDELTRVPEANVIQNNVDDFLDHADDYKLDEVEAKLKSLYNDFIRMKENNTKLTDKRNAALEERYVAQTAIASMATTPQTPQTYGVRAEFAQQDDDALGASGIDFQASRRLLGDQDGGRNEMMFSNVAGVIPQDEQDRFSRALFRATRGNTFTHFQQIFEPMQDPKTGLAVQKSVFVIYFQDSSRGGSAAMSAMGEKVRGLCKSFGVNMYRWPASRQEAEETKVKLQSEVDDQDRLLKAHESFVMSEAETMLATPRLCANSLIEDWRLFCIKEKAIYATLNQFEGHMNIRSDCWYPAADEDQIRALLISTSSRQQGDCSAMLVADRIPTKKLPPTYIQRNDFTACVQGLVDTYGLPRYQEANPMLFSLITFPFLFGVMYGDIGHGLMVLAVGLFLVQRPELVRYRVPELYLGRYLAVLMGFFAVYAGFMYNDFFSIGLNIFGSRWKEGAHGEYEATYDIRNEGGFGPYPFGLDPAWHGASNELIFLNSMKMKLAVIIGVVQMTLGLVLRFGNATYEKSKTDFFCECCPMMIFMLCFFGYMDFMILYKWVTPMDDPPSIINSLIAMGMWQNDKNPMFGMGIVRFLMSLCVLTVPWMLLPKPFILRAQHQKEQSLIVQHGGGGHGPAHGRGSGSRSGHMALGDMEDQKLEEDEEEAEEFEFGEVFIHQVIETIEYVLGTVSHTASYLRLWALSLAHQQLASVFFQKTLLNGMLMPFPYNIVGIYFTFAIWFGITVGILLGMDVMECFLHVLRLHWVEFQSKFYKADGYAFTPYQHKVILEERCA